MRNSKIDRRIILTGGGSIGHVAVNLALIPILLDEGWEIYYMGSKNGIEREIIGALDRVSYVPISTGKLRRYLSFENFKDVFKVVFGCIQSVFKIRKIRPNIVFSKGGFVSVPVLFGAYVNRIPSLTHESDLTPGLANKLVQPFVNKVFTTFPQTEKYIKSGKGEYIGPVIREGLFNGNRDRAKDWLGIDDEKPCILAMGGSLGAGSINKIIRDNLDELLKDFNIVHAHGKGGFEDIKKSGYYQFEYIKDELRDVLAYADIVVSRAGSNAIFEFLYYKKPMLLIPLGLDQSRGDQIDNAKSFEKLGYGLVLKEKDLSNEKFLEMINYIYDNRGKFVKSMEDVNFEDNADKIYREILNLKK